MLNDINDTSGMSDEQREKHWQAQEDARTLSNAELIKNDPERLKVAVEMAKKMADKEVEEARAMSNVADTLFDKTKKEDN